MKTLAQQIYEMLVECTGEAMCDSGGAYGRHWQSNQGKTLADFENEPKVRLEFWDGKAEYYVISLFHYLTKQLSIDGICQEFNDISSDNWDDDRMYGVSMEAGQVLDRYNAEIGEGWNSYNGDSSLSQTIQGTYVRIADNDYVVLQIHGGCDVRGGYTDAKLFRIENNYGGCLTSEDVSGTLILEGIDSETPALPGCENIKEEDTVQFDNRYDGCSLRDENDAKMEIKETDNVSMSLDVW